METWLHPDDAFRLGKCLSEIARHVVVPCDMRMHQRVDRIEFNDPAAGGERVRESGRGTQCVRVPVVGVNMAATMRATVFVEPNRIELQERPSPTVGPLDALVRITTTTICGTDVRILRWRRMISSLISATACSRLQLRPEVRGTSTSNRFGRRCGPKTTRPPL
jgi:hypothetical protein